MRVWTDSTASQGICARQGLGKVRHLDVQELWVQQRIRNGDVAWCKVDGEENPGDLFTKAFLTQIQIRMLLNLLGCYFRDGRPASAPALRQQGQIQVFVPQDAAKGGPHNKEKWSDFEDEFSKEHSNDEVLDILAKKGLPHARRNEYNVEESKMSFPELP